MPIFARRRLQAMLDDLGPRLTATKAADLLARLEHKSTKDALAAEMELGLLWGIGQVADLEIDPVLPGSPSRPDAFSRDLFPLGAAVIEITALSDDTFSGRADMDRAANIVGQFADRIRRGASTHLYFQFLERSFHEKGRYHRIRRVTPDFELTPALEEALRAWIEAADWPNPETLQLTDAQIDVVIQWKQRVHPHGRTFTTMPPIAYDLEDNPIFKALRRKERQLSGVPADVLKSVFLGDAGCNMLRELRPIGWTEVTGEKIINHFLRRSSLDFVCVFSPYHESYVFRGRFAEPHWKVTLFARDRQNPPTNFATLERVAAVLPRPRLEGYQARQWHQQRMFDPQGRGIYEGWTMTSKNDSVSMRMSARLVLEFLAGRITREQFHLYAFGRGENLLDREFRRGLTVQAARLEKGGVDKDDDFLVFEMEPDFAASQLRLPQTKARS